MQKTILRTDGRSRRQPRAPTALAPACQARLPQSGDSRDDWAVVKEFKVI